MLINEEQSGINNEIELLDGSRAIIDLREFYEIIDGLAFNYGLGACKSFTEFAEMVNEEDPTLLLGLKMAMNKRIRMMNGETVIEEPSVYRVIEDSGSTVSGNEKQKLVMFLHSFGCEKKELDEALAKIDSGKIKVPERDYNWITDDVLASSNFDLKGVLKQMREDIDNSVKINVSGETNFKTLKELNKV
jgi:hypothetical protein